MTDPLSPVAPRDLAALFAMRLAHDLAGPLGAVTTGLDLLDGGDAEVRQLIADGVAAAAASLKLHRFIVAPPDDAAVAPGLLAAWVATRGDVALDWRAAPSAPAIVVGLAMTAAEAARRGGTLTVDGDRVTFAPAPTLDPAVAAALAGEPVTIARAALAGIVHAAAASAGGTIAVDREAGALCLGYHGSALPR
jgi:histidine phosphotransferase ChpT